MDAVIEDIERLDFDKYTVYDDKMQDWNDLTYLVDWNDARKKLVNILASINYI